MSRLRSQRGTDIWPGFVDALATLLLVLIFLVVLFMLGQFILSQALSGRDEQLQKLAKQVSELSDLLSLERQANADLRLNVAQLSASLQQSTSARDQLINQLDALTKRAEEAEAALLLSRKALERTQAELTQAQKDLAERNQLLTVERDTVKAQLAELESLKRDIAALKKLRAELEDAVGDLAMRLESSEQQAKDLTSRLSESEQQAGALRDRTKELEARLADQEERTRLAQVEIKDRDIKLSELQALYLQSQETLTKERSLSEAAQGQVNLLNQQIAALRQELQRLNAALEAAELKDQKSQTVIADLGRRLNQALASKVEELSRYRSEFFGRLRKVLGQRRDIRVVGDRFVFQSEVLFGSGSAVLGDEGQQQLATLARTLLDIAGTIPSDLEWILRVDGHTDQIPINNAQFASNWELSTARAISVVKYLVAEGVPAHRLAATGFGEFQPIDSNLDEIANRRNRRIELKLTQR